MNGFKVAMEGKIILEFSLLAILHFALIILSLDQKLFVIGEKESGITKAGYHLASLSAFENSSSACLSRAAAFETSSNVLEEMTKS